MQRANSAESSTGSLPQPGAMVEAWLQNNNPDGVFTCHICSRAFSSIQALGDHQKAHRRERAGEMTAYICQHLDTNPIINNDDAAFIPPENNVNVNINNVNNNNNNNNGFDEVGEPSSKRAKIAEEDEDSSVDLTLSVGRAGTGRENGLMNYNYPDVLFPASEFMDLTVDLDLKL